MFLPFNISQLSQVYQNAVYVGDIAGFIAEKEAVLYNKFIPN
jgi:hypothetical protein